MRVAWTLCVDVAYLSTRMYHLYSVSLCTDEYFYLWPCRAFIAAGFAWVQRPLSSVTPASHCSGHWSRRGLWSLGSAAVAQGLDWAVACGTPRAGARACGSRTGGWSHHCAPGGALGVFLDVHR